MTQSPEELAAAMKESPELYAEMYIEMQKANKEMARMLGDALQKTKNEEVH